MTYTLIEGWTGRCEREERLKRRAMAQTGDEFLAAASTPSVTETPNGDAASTSAIATPDTLPPPWSAGALSDERPLAFNTDPDLIENDNSTLAAKPVEGTSSRSCRSRSCHGELVTNHSQSTGTAGLAATSGGEPGRGAPGLQPEEPPDKAVLLERAVVMFLRGKGRLIASGGRALITVLTRRVLLDASEVIRDFDVQRPDVKEACGQKLDEREALAFLLGDVLLGARIPDEYARKRGDALGKLVFGPAAPLPKDRTALRRAHDKRVGRLSKLNPDYQLKLLALTGESDRLRDEFECKQVPFALPSLEECHAAMPPPLPPAPPPPPPPDPLQARFEAWCHRHHPGGMLDPVDYWTDQRKYLRFLRALKARAWKPRDYTRRKRLAQTLEVQKVRNRVCTCDDHVPSWLCQAHVCYAFEIGMCDGMPIYGGYPSARVQCDCMRHAFGHDPEQRWPEHKPELRWDWEDCIFGQPGLHFPWLDPPPGGHYGPGFDPQVAARKLTTADVHLHESDDSPPLRKFPSYGKL